MKLDEYHLRFETDNEWRFPNTKFNRVNLIVGAHATEVDSTMFPFGMECSGFGHFTCST